ncbi:hypothetical protein NDU88_001138 [Pleurodeles waltl]|uniref:Uncharacterized protein n=1 Tax=Pleurodeles waltl TaxID=8319 RepID=A0AAV7URY0_PLEWA|nr:hypothetical protein NDU88_001138 [Pleurodeles waltl]
MGCRAVHDEGLTGAMGISQQGDEAGQQDLGRAGAALRPQDEVKAGPERLAGWRLGGQRKLRLVEVWLLLGDGEVEWVLHPLVTHPWRSGDLPQYHCYGEVPHGTGRVRTVIALAPCSQPSLSLLSCNDFLQ